MAIKLNDNLKIIAPKPTEERFLHPSGRRYVNAAEVNSVIKISRRFIDCIVSTEQGLFIYDGGVEDTDLVPFNADNASGLTYSTSTLEVNDNTILRLNGSDSSFSDIKLIAGDNMSVESLTGDTIIFSAETGELGLVDEGNGIGYRIKDRNTNNYGDIGLNAIDLSLSNSSSTTKGAIANNSFAVGLNVTASGQVSYVEGNDNISSGYASHAEGIRTTASGDGAHAGGEDTVASGDASHAEGNNTIASGLESHAQGRNTFARALGEHSGGVYGTDYTPVSGGTISHPTDRLVNYGNGTDINSKDDAFTIYKNGAVRFYRTTTTDITNTNKEGLLIYDSGNNNRPTINNGTDWEGLAYESELGALEAIDEGNGIGYVLRDVDRTNFEPIGDGSINLSRYLTTLTSTTISNYGVTGVGSFATGFNHSVEGAGAFAGGAANFISGQFSTAFGFLNSISGSTSIIFGARNSSNARYSASFGNENLNTGDGSSTLGIRCTARAAGEVVVGANSLDVAAQNSNTISVSDLSFHIGTSGDGNNRNSQFFVFRSGLIKYRPIDVKNASFNPNVPNGVEGAFGLDNQNNNRPTIHNGTDWKEIAYVDDITSATSGVTNTIYTTSVIDSTGNAIIRLSGSDNSTDDITLIGGTNTTLDITGDTITINGTESGQLEALDEGNGIGYVIKSRSSGNYGVVGNNAKDFSFSTGPSTIKGATGQNSFASGQDTEASNFTSHAEGYETIASGAFSHAGGYQTTASGTYSFTSGNQTTASGSFSHAEGNNTTANGDASHTEGQSTTTNSYASHAEGINTQANGYASHAEGQNTITSGGSSHAEGTNTTASGDNSHAEGYQTTASGYTSHVEGINSQANSSASHAEGFNTESNGEYSHAEGNSTITYGVGSHAEGQSTIASGNTSHAEGFQTTASGEASHTEGVYNYARALGEHSGGVYGTDYIPVSGGTTSEPTDRLVNYGNGSNDANRSDAFTIYKNGAVRFFRESTTNITNASAGFFIYNSNDNNRPTIHNGSDWKGLAYLDDITSATSGATNTTYTTSVIDSTGDAIIRLSGSDSSIDDIILVGGTNTTLDITGDTITINSTASAVVNSDDYVTDATFSASTGDLNLTTLSGNTIVENLDGRYVDLFNNQSIDGEKTFNEPITINSNAIGSTREDILKAKVSDNATDTFIIANGTTGNSRFIPTFVGYTEGNYETLIFRGLGSSTYDVSTSEPFVTFKAALTSNPSDPNNGVLTIPSNRDLFSFGSNNTYMLMKAGGRLLLSNNNFSGDDLTSRLQVSGNIKADSFINRNSTDDYVLLGGGGTKLLSELGSSSGGVTQTLNFNESNGDLSILSGNTVNLDGRYSLTGHTHQISDITNFPTNVSYFNNDVGYITSFTNSYVTDGSFNTGNGDLTLTRNNNLPNITIPMDGRYVDLLNNQTIGGNKTFTSRLVSEGNGTQQENLWISNGSTGQNAFIWLDNVNKLRLDGGSTAARDIVLNGSGIGNVGVNNVSPAEKIHVSGPDTFIAADSGVYKWGGLRTIGIKMGTENVPEIDFRRWVGNTEIHEVGKISFESPSNNSSYGFNFKLDRPTSNVGATTSAMFIERDGDVGIGTTIPSEKLEVIGSVKIGDNQFFKAGNTWIRNNGSVAVISNQGTGSMLFRPNGDGSGTGEMSLQQNGNLLVSGDITAAKFFQSSLREFKTNIKTFESSGLSLVNDLNIVGFDYKEGGEDNIGVIADDTTSEFLSENKDAVNLYNTIFIQAKAIQELSKKNEELEERLDRIEKLLSNG